MSENQRINISSGSFSPNMLMAGGTLTFILMGLLIGVPAFIWYFCRIEVESGQIAVLIHKTGTDLPSGEIIALKEEQKGIQLQVLSEGRYFKDPYNWGWEIHRITDIPAGKLGVVTRLYGNKVPSGNVLANDGDKGILTNVLSPGKYRVNPYAERIELFDAINIRPGYVGVITNLVGHDVLDNTVPEAERNTFLVAEGTKGVVAKVLDPGTYYLNPYIYSVTEVDLRSQRFEMSGDDAISFLTMDGFYVRVEGTIEFSIARDQAAYLTHRVGDIEDVVKKIIMPRARGYSRIEGSKNPAVNYIVGETRQLFEDQLKKNLQSNCHDWGVTISSVLIRSITPPEAIASVIREREVAVQNSKKFEQQIIQAQSRAELSKQEMLAQQNKEKVEADTVKILAVIQAEQNKSVKVVAAERELDVAKIDLQSAVFQAEAILANARAEQSVIRLENKANADVFATNVKAFGSGMEFARYHFFMKAAPNIESILSDDGAQSIGSIFKPFTDTTHKSDTSYKPTK